MAAALSSSEGEKKASKIDYFQQNVCFSLLIFILYTNILFLSKDAFELVRELKKNPMRNVGKD